MNVAVSCYCVETPAGGSKSQSSCCWENDASTFTTYCLFFSWICLSLTHWCNLWWVVSAVTLQDPLCLTRMFGVCYIICQAHLNVQPCSDMFHWFILFVCSSGTVQFHILTLFNQINPPDITDLFTKVLLAWRQLNIMVLVHERKHKENM